MKQKKISLFKIILLALIIPSTVIAADFDDLVDGVLLTSITDTTATSVIPAQGTGIRTYVDKACVQNAHATVGTWVYLLNGSTKRDVCYTAKEGGGCCIPIKSPLRGDANAAWKFQAETSGADIRGSMSGFKSYR